MQPLTIVDPDWRGHGADPGLGTDTAALADAALEGGALRLPPPGPGPPSGDLEAQAARFGETLARLREAAPSRTLLLGATCGVEAAPVAYHSERWDGDLAVVWLDAHADLNTPSSSPSGRFHGMVLRTLLGDGPDSFVRHLRRLRAEQVVLAGLRAPDPPETAFIEDAGIAVVPPERLLEAGALRDAVVATGCRGVYVHVDLDVFALDAFPDVLMPTPGSGPTPADVVAAVAALAGALDVVGLSVVEFRDRSGRGLEDAARLVGDLRSAVGWT